MDKETVVLSYDVIVVGSGGAGSAAAHFTKLCPRLSAA